ncbi:MAG: FAD-dependent oxidoreductase [Alcaligenaceae bacterium]|nr:FAD-dependent oxidoreductase [Alcaligenaceae bacterium SAGV3]MPT57959.1 FAD-dependent oxidoreductase [Alcaligenaceae bacterium]
MNVAIVGAGWAGLSALVHLARAGHAVTVFEAARTLGGRARRVERAHGFETPLDNGQHLLLGAYRDTLALMRDLGLDVERALRRLPLTLQSVDARLRLRAPRWPAPFHVAAALLAARGLAPADKFAALHLMTGLRRAGWQAAPGESVVGLLDRFAQPTRLRQALWHPLCLAALNTTPDQACAELFCATLRDSLGGGAKACDLLLPRQDLSALWPDAAARLGRLRNGCPIRHLEASDKGYAIDGAGYDAIVLAVPPYTAARLLGTLPADHPARPPALLAALRAFEYSPIATLTLRLDGPYRLPLPMMMLREDTTRSHDGQWVFDRGTLLGLEPAHGELAIVVSCADSALQRPRQAAEDLLLEQLREQLTAGRHAPLPKIAASAWIVEKRATFLARPGLARPPNTTGSPKLMLAGDWTDTGYPATLEGAVRSGKLAAQALIASG